MVIVIQVVHYIVPESHRGVIQECRTMEKRQKQNGGSFPFAYGWQTAVIFLVTTAKRTRRWGVGEREEDNVLTSGLTGTSSSFVVWRRSSLSTEQSNNKVEHLEMCAWGKASMMVLQVLFDVYLSKPTARKCT